MFFPRWHLNQCKNVSWNHFCGGLQKKQNTLCPHKGCNLVLETRLTHSKQIIANICCCYSVAASCPTLCNPMSYSMPGFPVLHYLPEFAQTHVHWQWRHPTISSFITPFFSCLQSFPVSTLFSNEPVFRVRWPKYWSFPISKWIFTDEWILPWIFRTNFL